MAKLCGAPLQTINYLLYGVKEHNRYEFFEVPKRAGGVRVIEAPTIALKRMQRKIAEYLDSFYTPSPYVHGYVAARSIQTNARNHVGQRWILAVDITDFFPSIHFGRVRGMLMSPPFGIPEKAATLMAAILTVRDHVPHGSPASPTTSNIICMALDRRLSRLAKEHRVRYSRYADDIIFSTRSRRFPTDLAHIDPHSGTIVIGETLIDAFTQSGFTINFAKVRLTPASQRQVVTGLVVNDKVNVPRRYVRSTRSLLHIWRVHGEDAVAAKLNGTRRHIPMFKQPPAVSGTMRGRVQYIGQVIGWRSSVYQGLASQLESLDGAFRRHPAPPAVAPSARVVLYCEGETDYLHIEAAMSALPTVLSGNGLEVVLKRNVKSGDSHLLKMLEVLKESPPEVPTVCVFDRDVPDTVRKVTDDAGGPRAWGKHVASLALPSGEGDQPDARVCMEMLYDEVTLQHEINGRRLYFRHEFDAGGWHKDGSKKYAEGFVKGSSLIMEGVSEQGKASGVALTKKAFAQAVRQAEPPFDNVDFSRFQRLFEDIAKAVKLSLGFSAGED